MLSDPTIYVGWLIVAAFVVLAVGSNRNQKHPVVSAFGWMGAITVLLWTGMVWFATK
jgi:hypothetical protein